MGGLQLLLISIITDYSLILMIKCGELSGARSYQVLTNFFISIAIEEKSMFLLYCTISVQFFFSCFQGMMEKAFGRIGFFILTFIQFVYPFIGMIFFTMSQYYWRWHPQNICHCLNCYFFYYNYILNLEKILAIIVDWNNAYVHRYTNFKSCFKVLIMSWSIAFFKSRPKISDLFLPLD